MTSTSHGSGRVGSGRIGPGPEVFKVSGVGLGMGQVTRPDQTRPARFDPPREQPWLLPLCPGIYGAFEHLLRIPNGPDVSDQSGTLLLRLLRIVEATAGKGSHFNGSVYQRRSSRPQRN